MMLMLFLNKDIYEKLNNDHFLFVYFALYYKMIKFVKMIKYDRPPNWDGIASKIL